MITLKNLSQYSPKNDPYEKLEMKIIFLQDENSKDWYESQKTFSEGTLKVMTDKDGVIRSYSNDVSALFPENCSVTEFETKDVPTELKNDGAWVINDKGEIIKRVLTNDELIKVAENERSQLLIKAKDAIEPLQDAVDLGTATDEESAQLKKWKQYRVDLNRVDLSKASDINWPTPP